MTIVVVADASPLVAFSLIKRLELLYKLFGAVQVVQTVMQEVLTDRFTESEEAIRSAFAQGWMQCVDANVMPLGFTSEQMMGWKQLDPGEAHSIAYVASLPQKALILMDERAGKSLCDELGLATLGTVGILLAAHRRGLITQVRPELERLHQAGFWLAPTVMKRVLSLVGEQP